MKRLDVFGKARSKFADLAAREIDVVSLGQFATDLFPLTVVQEALQTDMNLQVVTINPSRSHLERQCFGSPRH